MNIIGVFPLNNAAILVDQKWLAPTASVSEQLYRTLYEVDEQLTQLLYRLIPSRFVK